MKRIFIGLMVLAMAGFACGRTLTQGDTHPTIRFVFMDTANPPQPITGLNYYNMTFKYVQQARSDSTTEKDGQLITITDSALADPNSAWSAGGFVEIGDGLYRLDLPAASVAGEPSTSVTVVAIYDTTNDIYRHYDFDLTPAVNVVLSDYNVLPDHGPTTDPIVLPATAGTDFISADSVSAAAVTKVVAGVWNALVASYTTDGTFGLVLGSGSGAVPPDDPYSYQCATENADPNFVSTQTLLYYSGQDNIFVRPGATLAVKNVIGFYEKPVVAAFDNNDNTISFYPGMVAPPANGEAVYLVETSKWADWLKYLIRSVMVNKVN